MSRPAQDRPMRIRREPRHRPDARFAIRGPERLESRRLPSFGPSTTFPIGGIIDG